jgi:hypothetical protein
MSQKSSISISNKIIRISALVIVALCALVSIVGKGGGGAAVTPAPETQSVAIEPATAPSGLPLDFPVQLAAKATLSDGQVTDVTNSATWASADSNIVEVSATGVVTGKMQGGPVAVTATSAGKASAPLNIEVKSSLMLTKLEITPFNPAALPVGEKRTHTAVATFVDGGTTATYTVSEEVDWESDNQAVVRFDEPSVALAMGNGTTMIRAKTRPPVMAMSSNDLPILVTSPDPQALAISPVPLPGKELLVGFNFQAKATFFYSATDGLDVTDSSEWSSSAPGILTVGNVNSQVESKGFLVPMSPGTATITATRIGFPNQVATQEYTVSDTVINNLNVSVPQNMPVGLDVKVEVTADLASGRREDVSQYAVLSVLDPQVATVSNSGSNKGFLTGLMAAGTTLMAELPGSNISAATQAIGFEDVSLNTIAVTDTRASEALHVGLSHQFSARGTFTLASGDQDFDVTRQANWASSMENIATVSNTIADKGLVTAVGINMMPPSVTSISASLGGIQNAVDRDVSPATLVSIATEPANPTLPLAAGTFSFKAMGTFSDMSMQDITASTTWFTGNSTIAKFDAGLNQKFGPGLVRLRSAGVTSVTVGGTGGYSGVVGGTQLSVDGSINPTAVTISGPTMVEVGKRIQLAATGTFDNMSMYDVTLVTQWTADNTNVSVLQGGVTGRATGMSTVTATYANGLTDTWVITVNP